MKFGSHETQNAKFIAFFGVYSLANYKKKRNKFEKNADTIIWLEFDSNWDHGKPIWQPIYFNWIECQCQWCMHFINAIRCASRTVAHVFQRDIQLIFMIQVRISASYCCRISNIFDNESIYTMNFAQCRVSGTFWAMNNISRNRVPHVIFHICCFSSSSTPIYSTKTTIQANKRTEK